MKCIKCKSQTSWDTSYGYEDAIICQKCFKQFLKELGSIEKVMKKILKRG